MKKENYPFYPGFLKAFIWNMNYHPFDFISDWHLFLMNFTTINEFLECYLFTETCSLCCQCDPWLLTGTVGGSQQKPHLWYVLYPPGFCHPPTSQTLVLIASCNISQPLLKIWEGEIIIILILDFSQLEIFLWNIFNYTWIISSEDGTVKLKCFTCFCVDLNKSWQNECIIHWLINAKFLDQPFLHIHSWPLQSQQYFSILTHFYV